MRTYPLKFSTFPILLLLFFWQNLPAQEGPRQVQEIFLIGNSLTWDTLPPLLGEGVAWHVDCGKNLKYIYENPSEPCVKSSMIWTEALKTESYDILCVQPHFGTTLAEDVTVISAWLDLQPKAKLVIHTGWNRSADFEAVYHAKPDGDQMAHQPSYFEKLMAALQEKYPQREITTTRAIQVLNDVYQDIQRGQAPFEKFDEIYRDAIHLDNQTGRYLMHNLLRLSLGMECSDQGFQIEPEHKEYFHRKLDAVRDRQAK